jgi:hypothetical protein
MQVDVCLLRLSPQKVGSRVPEARQTVAAGHFGPRSTRRRVLDIRDPMPATQHGGDGSLVLRLATRNPASASRVGGIEVATSYRRECCDFRNRILSIRSSDVLISRGFPARGISRLQNESGSICRAHADARGKRPPPHRSRHGARSA